MKFFHTNPSNNKKQGAEWLSARITKLVTGLCATMLFYGCSGQVIRQGNIYQELNQSSVQKGASQEDVIRIMGYPSFIHPVSHNIWFYYGSILKQKTFYHPQAIHQHVLILYFDDSKVLEKKCILKTHHLKDIAMDRSTTSSAEKEEYGLTESLARNIGHFDKRNKK